MKAYAFHEATGKTYSRLLNDPTLWRDATASATINANTDDERAYSPGLGGYGPLDGSGVPTSAFPPGGTNGNGEYATLADTKKQFDLGTGMSRNSDGKVDLSPRTAPFHSAVKTALLTTPLDAAMGPKVFNGDSASATFDATAGAEAKAIKALITTATTTMDKTDGSFIADYGPIGGTVYYACDEALNADTTNTVQEKASEALEKLNNLKSCEASGGTNTTPTSDKKKSDDDSSLTWLWWVLGVLGFLIIAAAIYYFAVVRRKRIMEAEARHHHDAHHVPTHHDVVHRDVHVVSHH